MYERWKKTNASITIKIGNRKKLKDLYDISQKEIRQKQ